MPSEQPSPFPRTGETIEVAELLEPQASAQRTRPRRLLPIVLFIATGRSTYLTGGLVFSLALMFTLLAHELGHYLQARRYGVPASLPYFIPMPLSPIGTMGAVILMSPGMGNRRTLFDIGITGPLVGLVPALLFCVLGLHWSEVVVIADSQAGLMLGEPLLFKLLVYLSFGSLSEGQDVLLHPVAFAGWVGIFITALNLFPIGQLDGGHVVAGLWPQRAVWVSRGAAVVLLCLGLLWPGWAIWLAALALLGAREPLRVRRPDVPVAQGARIVSALGVLAFLLCFAPIPVRVLP